MNSEHLLTFDDLEDLLAEQDCDTRGSELQGLICGLYAGGMANDGKSWKSPVMQHLNDGRLFPSQAMEQLESYVAGLGEQLEQDVFAMEMAIPDDTAPIVERLEAICQWSQGFLHGYGLQLGGQRIDSEELNEALEDLTEIAKVDLEVEENEEMEQALYTVVEHVRVTSQVIFLETRSRVKQALHEMQSQPNVLH
jgi:hypothetical protein